MVRKQTLITSWLLNPNPTSTQSQYNDNETTSYRVEPRKKKKSILWPSHVRRIWENWNPEHILFPLVGETTERCHCKCDCNTLWCHNAAVGAYCDLNNCNLGGNCSNTPHELYSLYLTRSRFGVGVAATTTILKNSILGEYCGILCLMCDTNPYVMELHSRSVHQCRVFIDANKRGSIWRFANHSCQPNCRFMEMVNGRRRKVVVVSNCNIPSDEELTVSYGKKLWFRCECQSCQRLPLMPNTEV